MSPMCGRLALARAALWAATRRWNLALDRTDPRCLLEILNGPPPPMESFAVSKAVNNPRNDGPELVERA